MANVIWRGDAPAVAQVTEWTLGGTWEADDVITVTINGKVLTMAAGSTTISDIIDALVIAYNASTIPEFAEMTASKSGTTIFVLTADTAGVPFTAALATDEAGGGGADAQTISAASTTTASAGPNDWSTARNWSGNAVPVNSDDVFFQNSNVPVLYGLAQSGVTLTSLTIDQSYEGTIGLPRLNVDAGTAAGSAYFEYRDTYLLISVTTLTIGRGEGAGSGRLKINVGSNACALNVFNSGTGLENGLEAVLFVGTSSSNAAKVSKGSVGIAVLAGEAANLSGGLTVGYIDNQAGDAAVRCGTGVTLATVTQSGGQLTTQSAITTLNKKQNSGDCNHLAGALTTLNGDGGTVYYRSPGTLGTANVGKDCTLDFSRDPQARTVSACNVQAGATIKDPNETVTWSAGWVFPAGVGLADVTLDIGEAFTLTKS